MKNIGINSYIHEKKENLESYPLTEKQIRSFPDFKNISSEELLEIRESIYEFSLIVYEYISREPGTASLDTNDSRQ